MDHRELYKQKLTDVDGALGLIRSGDNIITGGVGVEPAATLKRLHTLCGRVRDLTYMNGLGFRSYPFMELESCQDMISTDSVFLMGPGRQAHRKGLLNVYPGHLHIAAERWFHTHDGRKVFVAAATPMDRHGYMRVSLCLIHERFMLDNADVVILEVNPNMPTVFGDTQVHISDVACVVETDYPMPFLESAPQDEAEQLIGANIAQLVRDGDCIQLGIGAIPDAAAQSLMDKHDLGIHTEMLTNSMVDLVESGVVTGKKKNVDRGMIVAAFALGNQRLYDFIDENPGVQLRSGAMVNSPWRIAKIDNFVSVNTAMGVDLSGQICSESIGSLHYSGSGGQADTAIGALHSKGGRNIIALKSTRQVADRVVSNINAQLPAGSIVTLSRNDVDYIVTEFGIAPMRGRNVRQRVDNLIAVAHPDFRAQLKQDAEKLLLW